MEPLQANPLGLPIGSQTYPHRQTDGDFDGLLKTLKAIGVDRIELCSPFGYRRVRQLVRSKQVRKTVNGHGMKPRARTSACASCARTSRRASTGPGRSARAQMLVASLDGGNNPTMDGVKRAADGDATRSPRSRRGGHPAGATRASRCRWSTAAAPTTADGVARSAAGQVPVQMSTISQGLVADNAFTKYRAGSFRCTCRTWI